MADGLSSPNHSEIRRHRRARLLLLLLILLAFARLVWGLNAQALWLDEAFSLQRAESSWPAVIAGALPLTDGVRTVDTTDQHPFAYFVFLGLMLRAAGISEFVLRFPAVIAATLLVPVAWALSRRLARAGSLPRSAPAWVALLVAINPFYLWFGQEVRMYAQVALLALLSTYLLLRWADATIRAQRWIALAGYIAVTFLLLTSHYFAVLILPVQAAVAFQTIGRKSPHRTLAAAVIMLTLALIPAGMALSLLAHDPAAGTNWARISPRILAADLLNAFSMGLNVDIRQVWSIDLFFGAVAVLGMLYGLRRTETGRPWRGWVLPTLVLLPPAALLAVSVFRPAYMTARHMSLISGFFLLLVGGGVAWLWQTRRWAGTLAAFVLFAGAAYGTADYHLSPRHGGGDLAGMGQYLRDRVQPGDLLLTKPIAWERLYRYYLPIDAVEGEARPGRQPGWRGLPLLKDSWEETVEELETLPENYRRIWLIRSEGPDADDEWLFAHTFRAEHQAFESARASLDVDLLLSQSPVLAQPPATIQHRLDAVFGGQVRLIGYDLGRPLLPDGAIPVTLYWQPTSQLDRRYKYILRLVSQDGETLSTTEREPYNSALPTPAWPAGSTIVEYTEVPSPVPQPDKTRLVLQMYDAETLEKLPVINVSGAEMGQDAHTVVLPAAPPSP
jgi:mannosyltransferase